MTREELKESLIKVTQMAINSRMNGVCDFNVSMTIEGLGIEPILMFEIVDRFISRLRNDMKDGRMPNLRLRQMFYEDVCNTFLPKEEESNWDDVKEKSAKVESINKKVKRKSKKAKK